MPPSAAVQLDPTSRGRGAAPEGRADHRGAGRARATVAPGRPLAHQALLEAVADELSLRDPDGTAARAVTDLPALARVLAASVVDTAATWEEHLGGFYDVDGVRHLLSSGGRLITKQAVSNRRGLLALTTGSGRVVYPIFQFAGSRVVDGLHEVLAALPESLVSRWTLASWLVSEQGDLGGESPMALLRDHAASRVVAAARRWATVLAT